MRRKSLKKWGRKASHDKTSDVEKNRRCSTLSDCIVSLLLAPSPADGR